MLIVLSVVFVRSLLFYGIHGNGEFMLGGVDTTKVTDGFLPVMFLGLVEYVSIVRIAGLLGFLANAQNAQIMGVVPACISDFILLFPTAVVIQIWREHSARANQKPKQVPDEPGSSF